MSHVRVLGVLGGMGPLAGATFMQRLTLLTPAERDQDHAREQGDDADHHHELDQGEAVPGSGVRIHGVTRL